jgi:hypothetical protein
MDVSLRVHPEALVGRVLRVFWRTDDAWFPGGVESYDASTGRHKVGADAAVPTAGNLDCMRLLPV